MNPMGVALTRLLNVGLRGLTLISKFALLIFLARFLEPAEVGTFGLFIATVAFCVLGLGLDFYTYSQRELLGGTPDQRWGIIRHQLLVYSLAYSAIIPIAGALLISGAMQPYLIPWFILILILEHLAQEENRLLVALHRQLMASIVFFFRGGLWVWLVLFTMALFKELRNLHFVLGGWAVGAACALFIGSIVIIKESKPISGGAWDWKWIRIGLKTGLTFLAATLCLRALLTFDRFAVKWFYGEDVLGAYTLYAGIAMALFNFLDSGIFVFVYPKLVQSFRQGDIIEFKQKIRYFTFHTIWGTGLLAIGVSVLVFPVLSVIGKPIYMENIDAFWWLLGGISMFSLSMIPHYALYSFGADRSILYAHLGGVVVFALLCAIIGNSLPIIGVPVSVMGALAWILVFKSGTVLAKWKISCTYYGPKKTVNED